MPLNAHRFTTARRYVEREAMTHGRKRLRVTNKYFPKSGCATDGPFGRHPTSASVFSPCLALCANVCCLDGGRRGSVSRRFPGGFFRRACVTHPDPPNTTYCRPRFGKSVTSNSMGPSSCTSMLTRTLPGGFFSTLIACCWAFANSANASSVIASSILSKTGPDTDT